MVGNNNSSSDWVVIAQRFEIMFEMYENQGYNGILYTILIFDMLLFLLLLLLMSKGYK